MLITSTKITRTQKCDSMRVIQEGKKGEGTLEKNELEVQLSGFRRARILQLLDAPYHMCVSRISLMMWLARVRAFSISLASLRRIEM